MILVSHPTGNSFVRALLGALFQHDQLHSFHTTVAFNDAHPLVQMAPYPFRHELMRRAFPVPSSKVVEHPDQEVWRLFYKTTGLSKVLRNDQQLTDDVYRGLDIATARNIGRGRGEAPTTWPSGVYCYEDAALATFRAAKTIIAGCHYDLPIAYWRTSRQLLEEEAQRLPEWEPTLVGTRDSDMKLERKSREIELADTVICPSDFVFDSLPEHIKAQKKCIVAPFGSPMIGERRHVKRQGRARKVRFLFAGSMTQRKGLADVFEAFKMLNTKTAELVVMGSPVVDLGFYKKQYKPFKWEGPRAQGKVLSLMQTCDVLILPSIVEGRALVQQEAMMCGLPLIITPNTGGADLIEEGKTGFLVPIRSPEAIAEKITWFLDNDTELDSMRKRAREKAAGYTWANYQQTILKAIGAISATG